MSKVLIVMFSAFFILTGCEQEHPKEIGYGSIENSSYRNDYFNMSINVPDNWVVQGEAAQKALMDSGTDLIAGEDKTLKGVLKESQKQTVNLFSFFKYEQGAPVEFNPSIIAVAERVSNFPGIKRGSDYHFHSKKLLQSGQMKYEFSREIYTKDISGVSFDTMPMQISINGITVYQEYNATKINDYMLVIILTYSSESELNELTSYLSTLSLTE